MTKNPKPPSTPIDPGAEFKLLKCTQPVGEVTYVGSLRLRRGEVVFLEAWVVEHERPDGTKGKHFEGRIVRGDARHLLRTAKPDGPMANQVKDDLIARMNPEFDDKLPEDGS